MNPITKTLTLVAITIGLTTTLTPTAHADEPTPTILVIGDSITARYNDIDGDPMQGWWSMVANTIGAEPVVDAHSGSGTLMRGRSCTSTTFAERLPQIVAVHPTKILAAGGRNDFKRCSNGSTVSATRTQTQYAVRTFVRDLANAARAEGIPLDNVYTMTPWGSSFSSHRDPIKGWMSKWSDYYGVTYIEVGYLTPSYTVDNTHPNAAGNNVLRSRVLDRSDIGTP